MGSITAKPPRERPGSSRRFEEPYYARPWRDPAAFTAGRRRQPGASRDPLALWASSGSIRDLFPSLYVRQVPATGPAGRLRPCKAHAAAYEANNSHARPRQLRPRSGSVASCRAARRRVVLIASGRSRRGWRDRSLARTRKRLISGQAGLRGVAAASAAGEPLDSYAEDPGWSAANFRLTTPSPRICTPSKPAGLLAPRPSRLCCA